MISASNNISRQKRQVDELNVFPVPDGDTGTNMSMTISSAARELKKLENPTVEEVTKTMSSALLRGARGNSGVILSLLFRGFSKGMRGAEAAGVPELVAALQSGVESAYKAVMKPTEGTMLTVARVAAEQAKIAAETVTDPVELWQKVCDAANDALAHTPDQLPVLKKAGVVDAGGKGLCCIYEGMLQVLRTGEIVSFGEAETASESAAAMPSGEVAQEITFHYCTEFIVNRTEKNDPLALRAYLESIGDSVVVVDDESIIKCHVHTNEPGCALQEALKFGYLTNMKIENMLEQMAARGLEAKPKKEKYPYAKPDPETPVGFVAVAAGEGVQQLFTDLGVTKVVGGGQTMNPSTEDILAAVHATPSETVFVLPNNKNIIMAAEQAVALADRKIVVLPTRHIPQGLAAMLAYDPDQSVEDNAAAMTAAGKAVGTGQVTYASRDADFDGHKIRQGEILALEGSRLQFTERDPNRAAMKLLKQLVKKDSCYITVLYGKDLSASKAEELEKEIAEKYPDIDYSVINGGQPVYHYILSVE